MLHLPRPRELEAVRAKLRRAPITALLGPRQCGKTTLAQSLKAEHFFDLEDPRSLVRLDEPQTALERLTGTVVIDEVQRNRISFHCSASLRIANRPHDTCCSAAPRRTW